MNFDWSNYLTFAELLYQKANNSDSDCFNKETFYRCSISRAYYAAFCLARNFLKDTKQKEFSSNEHKEIQNYFLNIPNPEFRRVGNRLKMLHQDRKVADYDNSFHESPPMKAGKSITLAKKVQSGLISLI